MTTRESLYDEVQTLRQINEKSKEVEEASAKVIQNQAAEIEDLQRQVALADMYVEELQSTLAQERQGRDG